MSPIDPSMQQLYQQLIMDHAKQRTGFGMLSEFGGESYQKNPVCGDEVTLRVQLERTDDADDPVRLAEVGWEGSGCSISQASISILNELVAGKSLAEFLELDGYFTELMHSRGRGVSDEVMDALEDATAFEGVSVFPARIKCALLGWSAARDAIGRALGTEEFADVAGKYELSK